MARGLLKQSQMTDSQFSATKHKTDLPFLRA